MTVDLATVYFGILDPSVLRIGSSKVSLSTSKMFTGFLLDFYWIFQIVIVLVL